MAVIPKVKYGLIGGSGTWGVRFPEDYKRDDISLVKKYPSFDTPYGKSAPFKLIKIRDELVLRVASHGWTADKNGIPLANWICCQQVAWIFEQAGVSYILTDGSVGGIKNPENSKEPLAPWSVIITSDFIMYGTTPNLPVSSPIKPAVRMAEPFCRSLRNILYKCALKEKLFKVYKDGIYICTNANRFETEAEIYMMGEWGANIVGQTLGMEAPLYRNLGIHFASLNIVSNVAEGHVTWMGKNNESMSRFYEECAIPVGNTIIDAVVEIIKHGASGCNCHDYLLSGLESFPVKDA